MKQYIVDTNAILRFLLDDIPGQKKAVEELFTQAKKSKIAIIVPEIVVFELNFVLLKYYGIDKEKIINLLQPLVSSGYLQVESRNLFIITLKTYKSENISFVDCFLIAKSKLEKSELFTFDKKLKNLV